MERRCLVYHMHRFIDFRVQELQSVSRIFGCRPEELRVEKPFAGKEASPAWYASFPNDETARMVAERAMLVKGIFELWGEGSTWEEVEAWYWKNLSDERRERWTAETVSFKFTVDAFGRKYTYDESLELIHRVTSFVKFKGKVQMKDADAKFWIIVTDVSKNPGLPQDIPYRIYFGRELGLSRRGELITQYSLTKRRYLGPTSMHHELAFIMCNMALVDKSKLVFDPFVGTGSILVAAAHHRACTMGADIDVRVIREGKLDKGGEPVTVWTNFQDYGLPEPVGLVRFDLHTAPWRSGLQEVFDAIVCDPPYGVRAGGRKLEPKDVEISESQRSDHIAKTEPYTMGECLRDTLECAGKLLRVGGRLVFFMPSTPETADDPVPQHPMLSLVADSEQPLSSRYSRRLITMEKSQAYDSRKVEAFYQEHPHHEMAIDTIHDWVYDPQHPMQDRPNAKKRYRGKVH